MNKKTGNVDTISFEGRGVSLLEGSKVLEKRAMKPYEYTFWELINPSLVEHAKPTATLRAELHKRLTSPLLVMINILIALVFLLCGDYHRRGYFWRIVSAVVSVIALQGAHLALVNLSTKDHTYIWVIYLLLAVLGILLTSRLLGKRPLAMLPSFSRRAEGNR